MGFLWWALVAATFVFWLISDLSRTRENQYFWAGVSGASAFLLFDWTAFILAIQYFHWLV